MTTHTCKECSGPVGRYSKTGLCRACASREFHPRGLRIPIPDDFAELGATMRKSELAAHYGVHHHTIAKWRQLTGVVGTARPMIRRLSVPEDFARLAGYKTRADLAKHYGVSVDTITRWRRVAGLRRLPVTSAVHFRSPGLSAAMARGRRDETLAGRAVDHLRRYGPVYRCREDGEPDFAGRFWNRGGHVLSDDDVIQRARRLGFDPDDWKRLAPEPARPAPFTITKGA